MTTHREKILHFRCSYFRPCVCVPLFGPGGLVFKVHMVISIRTWMMQQVVGRFCIFVVAIASLCVCVMRCDRSCVKIPHFRCSYFWLVCVCVCACVCMCCDARHDSHVKIPCFHCSYFQLMCVFVCSALCLDRAGPALRCSSIAGISESESECVPCCQLPHFATLIFGYS